jgi:hypothetical protein
MSKKQFFLLVFLIIFFSFSVASVFLYLSDRIDRVETSVNLLSSPQNSNLTDGDLVETTSTDNCGEICKKTVEELVSKAVSTISSKTKVVEKVASTPKSVSTSYIPMGSTYTTTSTVWYTLDDTGIYIDLVNDYGSNATVSWEASLKVAHGNGQAYVRLWDDTNKIAVNGSELTTTNNPDYVLVSTGTLPFWKGRNLYKVQIKSLNSFEVSLTGGKIKVSY